MKIRYNFPLHQQDSFTTYTHARSAICLKHRTTLTKHTPLRDADMRHSLHNNGRGSSASLGCNLPITLENSHPPLCLHTQHPISYINPCSHFTILRTTSPCCFLLLGAWSLEFPWSRRGKTKSKAPLPLSTVDNEGNGKAKLKK